MKKSKGITLIALVITIIVLLILAGVSISLVVGDNGVLTQATNSVEANRDAKAKEEVEMAWAGATADYWNDWAGDTSTTVDEDFYTEKLNIYLSETKKPNTDVEVTYKLDGTYEVDYITKDQDTLYTFTMSGEGKATMLSKETASAASQYLVNAVEIGDYIDINFNENNYTDGWRVLSTTGSGRKGFVTLISAKSPLTYYVPSGSGNFNAKNCVGELGDLSTITITSEGQGFRTNKITSATSGTVNLLSHFSNNEFFDSNKKIHAFGCDYNSSYYVEGKTTGPEIETLISYITGDENVSISNYDKWRDNHKSLTDSGLKTYVENKGLNWNTKWNKLISIDSDYLLAGKAYTNNLVWGVSDYWDAAYYGYMYKQNSAYGVRLVVSLKKGIKVPNENYGAGTKASPIILESSNT